MMKPDETAAAETLPAEAQKSKKELRLEKKLAKKARKNSLGTFFSDFKKFISRGNIIDLAVAVVVGGAFTKIVNSLVADIIMPLITAMVGKTDLADLKWYIGSTSINWGTFLLVILDFFIVAFFIFLILRLLVNAEKGFSRIKRKQLKLLKKQNKNAPAAVTEAAPETVAEAAPVAVAEAPAPVESELDILKDIRALLLKLDMAKLLEKPEDPNGKSGT